MGFNTTLDNVIFKFHKAEDKKVGSIILTQDLTRSTDWYDVVSAGPDSAVSVDDKILLSTRMTSYKFTINGVNLGNTEDKSIICIKQGDTVLATKDNVIYEWLDDIEVKTESGIILVQNDSSKELETRRAKVITAGPNTHIRAGDVILIPYNKDAYKLTNIVEGKTYHNCSAQAVILYWRSNEAN